MHNFFIWACTSQRSLGRRCPVVVGLGSSKVVWAVCCAVVVGPGSLLHNVDRPLQLLRSRGSTPLLDCLALARARVH